jgi:CubicO group peptidase (beta-lactamase class C family)
LQVIFSATKGVSAVVVAILAQRGLIDLDAPVASYWPEFAQGGKAGIPVAWVLSHQAGLAVPPRRYSFQEMFEAQPVVDDLAAMEPNWEPGTRHGYHGLTYGWLVGEIVRRVTGRSLGTVLAEQIAEPLGLDLWIGLPEEQESRVAPVRQPWPPTPEAAEMLQEVLAPGSLGWGSLTAAGSFDMGELADTYNRRDVHAAELPASNGICTARSLSRLYAASIGEVDGLRLLEPDTVDRMRAEQVRGIDAVWGFETAFGLGFWLHTDRHPKLGVGSFGHSGPVSLGFADPETGVAFGYVGNQPGGLGGDPRPVDLIEAVKTCIGA